MNLLKEWQSDNWFLSKKAKKSGIMLSMWSYKIPVHQEVCTQQTYFPIVWEKWRHSETKKRNWVYQQPFHYIGILEHILHTKGKWSQKEDIICKKELQENKVVNLWINLNEHWPYKVITPEIRKYLECQDNERITLVLNVEKWREIHNLQWLC